MKLLKSFFAVASLVVLFSSCGGSDCKTCDIDGDLLGELCGEDLKKAEDTDGVRCK